MTSLSRNARVAELLHLILMTAPLRLIYIPRELFVSGNSSATANNVAAHEMLFRLDILNDLFTASMGIFSHSDPLPISRSVTSHGVPWHAVVKILANEILWGLWLFPFGLLS